MGNGTSLVRNATFTGLVNGTFNAFSSPSDALAQLAGSNSAAALALYLAPAVAAAGLPPPAGAAADPSTWSAGQWNAFLQPPAWAQLQGAQCSRGFDLCQQLSASVAVANASTTAPVSIVTYTVDPPDHIMPWARAFRNASLGASMPGLGASGYVPPGAFGAFVAAVVASPSTAPRGGYERPPGGSLLPLAVAVGGTPVPLAVQQAGGGAGPGIGSIGNALWTWKTPCPLETFQRYWLEGSAAPTRPAFVPAGLQPLVVTTFGGPSVLDWYSVAATADDCPMAGFNASCGSASVASLTGITVVVSFAPARGTGRKWAVESVRGVYDAGVPGAAWSGAAAALGPGAGPVLRQVAGWGLDVRVLDAGAPADATFPTMTGANRIILGIICVGIAFFTGVFYFLVNHFVLPGRVATMNGLPPPDYKEQLEFRGW